MKCDECGSNNDVRLYNDPETGDLVPFCEPCAVQILGDDEVSSDAGTEANVDDEFVETCTTAADYYREGEL